MALETRSLSAARVVPDRELRLLADGLQAWVRGISSERSKPPCIGIIDGARSQGTPELVDSLRSICPELGVRFASIAVDDGRVGPAGAFVDVLRDVFRAETPGDESAASPSREKYAEALSRALPELSSSGVRGDDEAWSRLSPELERSRLLDCGARALMEQAQRVPSVLAIQDVHLASGFTAQFLDHILRSVQQRGRRRVNHRLLIVVTGDSLSAEWPASLAALSSSPRLAFSIQAKGYSREDVRECCLRRTGEELSLTAREQLLRSSRGDPQHVAWCLERWTAEVDPARRSVEEQVRFEELAAERWQALDAVDREIVCVLACARASLEADRLVRALEAVDAEPAVDIGEIIDEIEERLARLKSAGWLEATGGGAGASLRFGVVPRLQSLAFEALPAARQRAWTEALIRVFVLRNNNASPEPLAVPLTLSLLQALERGASGSKRILRRITSGSEAEGNSAWLLLDVCRSAVDYLESTGCLREALEILDASITTTRRHGVELDEAWPLELARLLERTDNFHEAIDLWRKLVGPESGIDVEMRAAVRVAVLHGKLEDYDKQRSMLRRVYERLAVSDVELRGEIVIHLARCEHAAGKVADRNALLKRALTMSSESGQYRPRPELREALWDLAEEVCFKARDWAGALQYEEKLLCLREETGDLEGVLQSLDHMACLFALTSEEEAAQACLEKALELSEASRSYVLVARVEESLGKFEGDRACLQDAFPHLERAWVLLRELGREQGVARIDARLAEYEMRLCKYAGAARTLRHFVERRFGVRSRWPLTAEDGKKGSFRLPGARDAKDREAKGDQSPRRETLDRVLDTVRAGKLDEAFRLLEAALARKEFHEEDLLRIEAVQLLGQMAYERREVELALKSFEQSLKYLATTPAPHLLANAYLHLGSILLDRADQQRALDYTLRGLGLAAGSKDAGLVVRALLRVAILLSEVGDFESARVIAGTAAGLAREKKLPAHELEACIVASRAYESFEDLRPVRRVLSRAAELDQSIQNEPLSVRLRLERGWCHLRHDEFAKAQADVQEGLERAKSAGLKRVQLELRHLASAVDTDPQNPHKNFLRALDDLEGVLALAEKACLPRLAYEVLEILTRTYSSRGKDEVAEGFRQRADELSVLYENQLLSDATWSCRHQR